MLNLSGNAGFGASGRAHFMRRIRALAVVSPIVQDMIARIACVCFLVIVVARQCSAATVFLQNSDRISGEIEKLEGKHLSVKTAYAGVIEIDWTMVQGVNSDQVLQFSMESGMVLTGTVHDTEQGMQVSGAPGTPILPHNVKAISKPVREQTFSNRLSGAIEFGYSLTRGNSPLSQSSVAANGEYHSTHVRVQTDLTSLFSKQAPAGSASAHSLSTRIDYYLTPRAFVFNLDGVERDDREFLDLRTSVGGGIGWQIADTAVTQLSLLGGMTFINEMYHKDVEQPGRRQSTGEALIGVSLDRLQVGRARFSGKTAVYPSVLDPGRMRVVASAGVRMPVVAHLIWSVRLFERFDSRPVLAVKKNDYGLISSFGFAF
jgi:Protein of unknown function, DUF481